MRLLRATTYALQNIIHSYNQLRSDWVYLSDMPGEDLVSNAEEIFKTHNFKGDCEDFAVCIMSFCRARNIDAVFCLGKNKKNKNKGHIWIEIPICLSKDYDDKLKQKINKLINRNISIYTQLGIVWLRFAHGEKLNNYKLEYKLDFKGNILKY